VNDPKRSEETLFEALSQLPAPERTVALEEACGQDAALRERLETLLAAHDRASAFMAEPVAPTVPGNGGLRIPVPERLGDQIGPYKLIQQIGEGGCGVVYMAQQDKPVRRLVALKVIKLGMDTRQVVARFEAERQALALMDHPNIAKVLDAGATVTGRPFFVMELVRGIKITDYCDQNQLATAQRLELFIQVCRGVQHAHQKGVIHRDLKPSNILVTLNDGAPVPKVIDFGIAKATQGRLTDMTLVTAFEQFIGTPAYVSPEQALMTSPDIDTRSDIYSLGVLLYELLTGKTPFDTKQLLDGGLDELRRTIREREPLRPSTGLHLMEEMDLTTVAQARQVEPARLTSLLRGDLDWIVMKCLEKDRARRYETANGLARDIERHLNNEPVTARPPSGLYEFQKSVRRHWVGFSAVTAVVLVLAAGVAVSALQAMRARKAEREQIQLREVSQKVQASEAEQRRRAEDRERYAQRLLYAANMNLAQQAWALNNFGQLRQLLEDTAAYPERGFEWYYWQRRVHQAPKTLRGHLGEITSVAFSPDGQRIVTGSSDGTAKIWDAATGKEVFTLQGHFQEIISATFSPDGQRIATGSRDQTAKIWEAASGKVLVTLQGHGDRVNSVVFSPDGRRVATGSSDGTAKVWEAASGNELLTLRAHTGGGVGSVVFSPDGRRIATSSPDGTAEVWEAASGKDLLTLRGHRDEVNSVAFSPDGQRIVTTSNDRTAKVWDAASGKELFSLEGHRDGVNSAVFSPDGQRIVTGSDDCTARLWDAAIGKELFTFLGHERKIPAIAFSPDGQSIVTGSADWTAKLWQVADNLEEVILSGHSAGILRNRILAAAFSADGRRMVTGGADGTAKVWEAASGKELLTLGGDSSPIVSVAFSPDGRQIITAGLEGTAKLWEATIGKQLLTLMGHDKAVFSAAFSPDGRRLVTASGDGTARIWDGAYGKELRRLEGHGAGVLSVAFSPDGQRTVTGSADEDAKVWDVATGKELMTLKGHASPNRPGGWIWAVAFSPDGLKIVTGCDDANATVWDAASGKQLLSLKGHRHTIYALAFSADSRRILTGSGDSTAKLWDAASGENLLTLNGHIAPIRSVAFFGDGYRILTGAEDGTAWLWETATADQVATWQTKEKQDAEYLTGLWRGRGTPAEQKRDSQVQDPGMINQWLVLAPIPYIGVSGRRALAHQQIPDEANLHPRAGQRVRINTANEGELVWTEVQLQGYLIDFSQFLSSQKGQTVLRGWPVWTSKESALPDLDYSRADWCAAYAVCYIQSEVARTNLCIKVGSDDQSKVYLNGREVYRCVNAREYVPDQATVTRVGLKAGFNVLVFKVVNERGRWLGSIRLTDAAGHPVKGIRLTFAPAGDLPSESEAGAVSGAAPFSRQELARAIPGRDTNPPVNLIDLTEYYNAPLTASWHSSPEAHNDLSALPRGLNSFAGVMFDVRGLIQIGATADTGPSFPNQVLGIPIRRSCQRLHFLHAAIRTDRALEPDKLGHYIIYFFDGRRAELPILFGRDLADWWSQPDDENNKLVIAWRGENQEARKHGRTIRLFKTTWENPYPTAPIRDFDFICDEPDLGAPFLVALTAEP
jgi:WD40 repeat protein/serine/threonine protein kinase